MRPNYSVVVPVYNAEGTLHRCLDSLLSSERDDVEIILVDDGSQDNSGRICDAYAREHPCVHVIHKENGGPSAARNDGIEAAQGDYLLFVDSDDYVSEDFFECADRERSEYDFDLIHFSSQIERSGAVKELHRQNRFASFEHDAVLNRILESILYRTINTPCSKAYKRSIIMEHQIRFPEEAAIGEDWAFNVMYAIHISSMCCSDSVVYFVDTSNEHSLSRKENPDQEKQLKYIRDIVNEAVENSALSDADKSAYFAAFGFSAYRKVYSKSKHLHLQGKSWGERNRELWRQCWEVNHSKAKHPNKLYCWKYSLPVRLYLTWLIDAGTKKLTR